MNPLSLLLPYQRAWVEDQSRFKIWLASRQIGKSFAAAAEVALDCQLRPGTHWLLVSAGQRQALELMDKVKQWLKALDLVIQSEGLEGTLDDMKAAEVRLKNGSRITALPANPDTARGYSANLLLDEFALHQHDQELWRAIFPTITNPLKGQLKVRICSTPNGQANKFYELWTDSTAHWSRHTTTIHHALAAGLAVDIELLRQQAGDADTWRQEYECQFIDTQRTAFPYDLLTPCEDPAATLDWPTPSCLCPLPSPTYYLGIDIGALHDPTVALTLEKTPDRPLTVREVLVLQNVPLADQDALLTPRLARAARISIDASGLGLDIAQRLRRAHGGKVIEQRVTAAWKRQAFARLQTTLADRRLLLPPERRFRDDLHAYQVTGAGESATYHAPRTADGHSDITSALVHALDAAAQADTAHAFTAADATLTTRLLTAATRLLPRFRPRPLC